MPAGMRIDSMSNLLIGVCVCVRAAWVRVCKHLQRECFPVCDACLLTARPPHQLCFQSAGLSCGRASFPSRGVGPQEHCQCLPRTICSRITLKIMLRTSCNKYLMANLPLIWLLKLPHLFIFANANLIPIIARPDRPQCCTRYFLKEFTSTKYLSTIFECQIHHGPCNEKKWSTSFFIQIHGEASSSTAMFPNIIFHKRKLSPTNILSSSESLYHFLQLVS